MLLVDYRGFAYTVKSNAKALAVLRFAVAGQRPIEFIKVGLVPMLGELPRKVRE